MGLEGIRERMNAMTGKIIIPLKYRSRLPLNRDFYEKFSCDGISDSLIAFYTSDVLPGLCASRNGYLFGNAPYLDALVLGFFQERMTIGEEVARAKLEKNPGLRGMDEKSLRAALRDEKREEEVIKGAKQAAFAYELSQDMAERLFRELIERTLDAEVDYIMGR